MDIGTLTGTVEIEDQLSSALTIATDSVKSFAEDFDGAMGAVALSAGIAATAIAAVTGAIVALAVAGSDVNDVKTTFEHFTESVGGSATVLNSLRESTHGVITDFDLMKDSSRLLAAGVKLTSDQFTTLGEAAFAMQNRGLGSTKEMMDLISTAMVTGRTRALAYKLGIVDNTDALQQYADAHGIAVGAMSRAQTAEANRITVMSMLSKVTNEAGVQQLDFGEKIEATVVKFKNWLEELEGVVAESPHVNAAIDAVTKALTGMVDGASVTDVLVRGINSFADAVTASVPYIEAFATSVKTMFGVVHDAFTWIDDHAYIFGALAGGVGLFIGATEGVPVAMTLMTTSLTFFTGQVTIAELELENLKRALMGLPEVAPVVATGFGAMAASAGTFLIAMGPSIIAIAGISAALAIGEQAWALWSERSAQAASNAKQLTVDQNNLATINKTLHTHFTDLGEALKAADVHAAQLRAQIIPLTEAEKADAAATEEAAARKKVYDDAVRSVVDGVRKMNSEVNVSRDAFDKLGNSVLLSADAQKAFTTAMDKLIESGKQLSTSESARYEMITSNRIAITQQGEALLKVHAITLDQITALKAHGLSQAEVAAQLHVTTDALKVYETEMKTVRDLTRELADLEAKETKTTAQQNIDQHKRDFDDAVANLDKTSVAYGVIYDLLDQIRRKKDSQEKVDMSAMQTLRDNDLQELANKTYATYSDMAAHAHLYSREALNEMRQKVYDTQQAVFNLGKTHDDVQDKAQQKITATTAAQVGWNDSIMKTLSMQSAMEGNMDSQIKQVRTLAGEWLTAADAKRRFEMGNTMTYDLTTVAGVEDYRMANTGMTVSLSDEQIVQFAKAGGTLNDLMKYGAIVYTDAAKAGGAAILNMTALNDIMNRGGKDALSTSKALDSVDASLKTVAATATAMAAGVGGGGAKTTSTSFDALNAQQGQLATAGKQGTAEWNAIVEAMNTAADRPSWWTNYATGSSQTPAAGGGISSPVNTPYVAAGKYGFGGANSPGGSTPTTINVMLPDGRVLASLVTENMFNNLGLKV